MRIRKFDVYDFDKSSYMNYKMQVIDRTVRGRYNQKTFFERAPEVCTDNPRIGDGEYVCTDFERYRELCDEYNDEKLYLPKADTGEGAYDEMPTEMFEALENEGTIVSMDSLVKPGESGTSVVGSFDILPYIERLKTMNPQVCVDWPNTSYHSVGGAVYDWLSVEAAIEQMLELKGHVENTEVLDLSVGVTMEASGRNAAPYIGHCRFQEKDGTGEVIRNKLVNYVTKNKYASGKYSVIADKRLDISIDPNGPYSADLFTGTGYEISSIEEFVSKNSRYSKQFVGGYSTISSSDTELEDDVDAIDEVYRDVGYMLAKDMLNLIDLSEELDSVESKYQTNDNGEKELVKGYYHKVEFIMGKEEVLEWIRQHLSYLKWFKDIKDDMIELIPEAGIGELIREQLTSRYLVDMEVGKSQNVYFGYKVVNADEVSGLREKDKASEAGPFEELIDMFGKIECIMPVISEKVIITDVLVERRVIGYVLNYEKLKDLSPGEFSAVMEVFAGYINSQSPKAKKNWFGLIIAIIMIVVTWGAATGPVGYMTAMMYGAMAIGYATNNEKLVKYAGIALVVLGMYSDGVGAFGEGGSTGAQFGYVLKLADIGIDMKTKEMYRDTQREIDKNTKIENEITELINEIEKEEMVKRFIYGDKFENKYTVRYDYDELYRYG